MSCQPFARVRGVLQLRDGDPRLLLLEVEIPEQQQGIDQDSLSSPARGTGARHSGSCRARFRAGLKGSCHPNLRWAMRIRLLFPSSRSRALKNRPAPFISPDLGRDGRARSGVAEQGGLPRAWKHWPPRWRIAAPSWLLFRLMRLTISGWRAARGNRILQIPWPAAGHRYTPRASWGPGPDRDRPPRCWSRPWPGGSWPARPTGALRQLAFGQIELSLFHAGVDALQQTGVDLQLALFERGWRAACPACRAGRRRHRGRAAAGSGCGSGGREPWACSSNCCSSRPWRCPSRRTPGPVWLPQLLQALSAERWPRGLGGGAVVQHGLPITVLLAIADDLLGVAGPCVPERRWRSGRHLAGSVQHQGLGLLQIDGQLLLRRIQIRSRQEDIIIARKTVDSLIKTARRWHVKAHPARPEFIDEMRDGPDVSEPECPAYWRMRRHLRNRPQSPRKG